MTARNFNHYSVFFSENTPGRAPLPLLECQQGMVHMAAEERIGGTDGTLGTAEHLEQRNVGTFGGLAPTGTRRFPLGMNVVCVVADYDHDNGDNQDNFSPYPIAEYVCLY